MIRAHGVDFFDLVAERHRVVDEQLQELVWCRFASEELELVVDSARPCHNDAECDLSTHRAHVNVRSSSLI